MAAFGGLEAGEEEVFDEGGDVGAGAIGREHVPAAGQVLEAARQVGAAEGDGELAGAAAFLAGTERGAAAAAGGRLGEDGGRGEAEGRGGLAVEVGEGVLAGGLRRGH